MKWRYANQQAREMLGDDPLQKISDPVLVKSNPVREVFKCGKFFFKCDKRIFNGLAQEFKHALKIAEHGIPAVTHLAYCRNMLITLGVENSVELRSFLAGNIPDDAMLESFANFLSLLKNSNLRHNDLHSGNVLYVPEENKFLLVDLCSAKITCSLFKSPGEHYSHLVMEMRRYLEREKLFPLLAICHPDKNPEDFFEQELNNYTVAILAAWQKRKKQIISGYGKFIRKKGDLLFAADADDGLSNTTRITGDAVKYMLLHQLLELNHIPHRKVRAISGSDIYLEQLETIRHPLSDGVFEDFCHRLFLCGITSTPEDWQRSYGKVKFNNLAAAIEQSDLLEIENK